MPTFNKFNDFTEQLAIGTHDFDAHVFKVALTNTAPEATNTGLADITQITAGTGYTAGGEATTITVSETGGTTTISGTEITWTATGSFGAFRYAVLYNDSAASDNLIGWWDYGASQTLASGETVKWKPSNASPSAILTIA